MYGLLLWKMKVEQTENNIMLYFVYKNETTVVPKESLEKLEISIVKRGVFYQMILQKNLPHTKTWF